MPKEITWRLFPTVLGRRSDAKKNFLEVLRIAAKEDSIWKYLLVDKYHFPGSANEIIRDLWESGLLERLPEEFLRGRTRYKLTGKGVLAFLNDSDLQKPGFLDNFFKKRELSPEINCLMRTLKVTNLLARSSSEQSLLVKAMEGMVKLGWNLENLPEKEVNRRLTIILAHALVFSFNSSDNSLREYVEKNSELMPELEAEMEIAENMNPELLLESEEQYVQRFRLDMKMLVTEYLHAQELIGHQIELFEKSPIIPERIDYQNQREEIINLWKPFETFVCYQQDQIILHSRVYWPIHVCNLLGEFLSGKNNGVYCAAMTRKNDQMYCFSLEEDKACAFFDNLTKCPTLVSCAIRMKERIENHRKAYGTIRDIQQDPQNSTAPKRFNQTDTGKRLLVYYHYDMPPLGGDR